MRRKDLGLVAGACFLSAVVGGLVSRWLSDSSVLAQWQEPAYDFIDKDTVTTSGATAGQVLKYVDPDANGIGKWTPAEVGEGSIYTSKVIKVYPELAAGQTASDGTSNWTFGTWVELVPASTITSDFIITAITGRGPGNPNECLLELGVGASGSETLICQTAFTREADLNTRFYHSLSVPRKVLANSRVAVRIASNGTDGSVSGIKIQYIELPL